MFETKTYIFIGITLFLGLFQFGVSLLLRKQKPDTKRDEFVHMAFKQWGRRGIIFAIVMSCAYIIKESANTLILILFVALIAYNGVLLKKMIRKVDMVYPLSDPNGERYNKKEN